MQISERFSGYSYFMVHINTSVVMLHEVSEAYMGGKISRMFDMESERAGQPSLFKLK
jgi:hypothetical protein